VSSNRVSSFKWLISVELEQATTNVYKLVLLNMLASKWHKHWHCYFGDCEHLLKSSFVAVLKSEKLMNDSLGVWLCPHYTRCNSHVLFMLVSLNSTLMWLPCFHCHYFRFFSNAVWVSSKCHC